MLYMHIEEVGKHIDLDGAVVSCVDDDGNAYQVRISDIQRHRPVDCEICGGSSATYWLQAEAMECDDVMTMHHKCLLHWIGYQMTSGAIVEV